MTTQSRWIKVLLGGGIVLTALALVFGLLTPFVYGMGGPWGDGATGGLMGPGMMSGMMGPGMMGNGGFNSSLGIAPFGWLMALPGLLFPVGLLMLVGAGGVWLAQRLGASAEGTGSPAQSKQCPSCGQPVQNNWRNCPHCGTVLS